MRTAARASRRPGGRWRTDVLALLVVGAICGIIAAATAVASSGPPSHGSGSGSYKETSKGDDQKNGSDQQHTICHATGSQSNPYVVISPSVSGVYHGHIAHQHSEDIIPPFTYKGQTYSQNWDANGQAIYANGCRPKPPVDVCPNIDGVQTTVPPGLIKDANGKCVPPPVDVCPNIEGIQTTVPPGLIKDANGKCVPPPTDVCPNIPGVQTTIPPGLVKDHRGKCVPPPVDVCPNIEGVQTTVPTGLIKDANGNCVPPPTDVCPNLDGIQTTVPAGLIKDGNGNCVPPPTDVCPNIEGVQTTVPAGMVKDGNGNCVPPPTDVCPNLDGVQATVPPGMVRDASGNCVTPPGGPAPLVDLAITKVDTPDPVSAGNLLRYTIRVTNRGPGRATNVTVTDVLPAGVKLISTDTSQGSCSASGARITCRLGTMAVNLSATIRVTVRPAQPGVLSNVVRVVGTEGDPNPVNNTSTATTRVVAPFQPPQAARCDSVSVGRRTIAVGTSTTLRIVVKAGGRGLARARVRVRGAGIDVRTVTNRAGIARVTVRARRSGIVTISVASQNCQRRIGAITGSQPDLTG